VELCPRCGVVRNMQVGVSRRTETDPKGKAREIVTRTYHCETCGHLVRSKVVESAGSNTISQ